MPVYRFGAVELNSASRELRETNGKCLVLPAHVFDCVLHLVEQRGRAVGRDELIAVIWNRTDVSDNMLAQLMTRVRRLVGDTGEGQQVIRTVSGFGYQWIAATECSEAPQQAAVREAPASDVKEAVPVLGAGNDAADLVLLPTKTSWNRALGMIAATCCSGLLVLVLWMGWEWLSPTSAPVSATAQQTQQAIADTTGPGAILVLPAIVNSESGQPWQQLAIMAAVGESLHLAGQTVVPPDNSVALVQGVDLAQLDQAGYARLAGTVSATSILKTQARPTGRRWQVRIERVFGAGAGTASLRSEAQADEVIEATRLATEKFLLAQGVAAVPLPDGMDRRLALYLTQAQGASLAGRGDAARTLLKRAQTDFPDAFEPVYQLARLDVTERRLEQAATELDGLIARTPAHDDAMNRARATNLRAIVCYWQSDIACVDRLAEQVINLLGGVDNAAAELARAYFVRSMGSFAEARWDATLADLARARMIWGAKGDALGIARIDGNTGIIYRQRGRTREAIDVLQKAATQLQAFHANEDEAVIRKHLALALLDDGRTDQALQQEPRLRELAERSRNDSLHTELDLFRAGLFVRSGRLAEAAGLLAALDARSTEPAVAEQAEGRHSVWAMYASAQQDWTTAEKELSSAFSLAKEDRCDPRGVAARHLNLARLRVRTDSDAAGQLRDSLLQAIPREGRGQAEAYARLIDAEIALSEGDDTRAATSFEAAFTVAEAAAAPSDLLVVAESFVPWLLAHTRAGRAAEVVGRLGDMGQANFQAALLELRLYRATGPKSAWKNAFQRAQTLAGERAIPVELHP